MENSTIQFRKLDILESKNNFACFRSFDTNNNPILDFYSYDHHIAIFSKMILYLNLNFWGYSQTTQKHYKKVISEYNNLDYDKVKRLINNRYQDYEATDKALLNMGIIIGVA